MFRAFANVPVQVGTLNSVFRPFGLENVFRLHPVDIAALLEIAWDGCQKRGELGRPFNRSALTGFHNTLWGNPALLMDPGGPGPLQSPIEQLWRRLKTGISITSDHLISAYMIENTRIVPIMRRVIFEFLHGEKFGTPSPATHDWLRTTEQAFFRAPAPFFVTSVHSDIRPDAEATRRNAYQRMFGMDLNHAGGDNKPYAYVRGEPSNKEFPGMFDELAKEAWIGIINATNTSGTNPTDDDKLIELIKKLEAMLTARRIDGNLSREEFVFVTTMDWFRLAVTTNTSLVEDLRATATTEEQRLFKIAQAVGVPAHGLSDSYFDIADDISRLLLLIESGFFTLFPDSVVGLYTPGNPLERAMRNIITHWSIITGHDIKAGKVAPPDVVRRSA